MKPLPPKRQLVVYTAGPYRHPDPYVVGLNILRAWEAARTIWQWGHVAICPHMNSALMGPATGEDEIDFVLGDLLIIERAVDIVLMLPGYEASKGACAERAHAEKCGISIVYNMNDLQGLLLSKERFGEQQPTATQG